jgi:hypothetical protein
MSLCLTRLCRLKPPSCQGHRSGQPAASAVVASPASTSKASSRELHLTLETPSLHFAREILVFTCAILPSDTPCDLVVVDGHWERSELEIGG